VSVLRLSGIYGPGRNAVNDALAGRARMLVKPGQVFNRIHVEDLATATLLAARQGVDDVLNITDDEPAPPQDVIRYAHRLVGKPDPEAQDFATTEITPMARSFYSENKRVHNERSKSVLGMKYRYPTYRQGLDAILKTLL
jgi:nucleoside-diphosphate-sugar epimerase